MTYMYVPPTVGAVECKEYTCKYLYLSGFLLGIFVRGGKCRVVPAVGGHGRCAACSLEEGVGGLPQKILIRNARQTDVENINRVHQASVEQLCCTHYPPEVICY